jgi:hypothetical protein
MASNTLTARQQVWLAAWSSAIQSAKYNPAEEAKNCLQAFDAEFGERTENLKKVIVENKTIPFIREVTEQDDK